MSKKAVHKIKPIKLDKLHLLLFACAVLSLYFNIIYYRSLHPSQPSGEGYYAGQDSEVVTEIAKDRALLTVQSGDSFSKLLIEAGISPQVTSVISTEISKIHDLSQLQVGQKIEVIYQTDKSDSDAYYSTVASVAITSDHERIEAVHNRDSGLFETKKILAALTKEKSYHRGEIKESLYADALKSGASASVIHDFIQKFSHEIDFQRDIQNGDCFEIYYEKTVNDKGKRIEEGPLLYGRLTVRNKNVEVYRYKDSAGNVDYFDSKGRSIKRTLLRTPISGAKISSGYGMRRHPILGFSKMHQGLDYAAPVGTPILAAGDGVVKEAKYSGNGYGRYIIIRHTDKYESLYAHISKFANGVRQGFRVSQGDVIGYVGTSGRTTGPHLHYEVIERGRKINPAQIQFPKLPPLQGERLESFQQMVAAIQKDIANSKAA